MKCSVVMSTRNKCSYLRRTLESIYIQKPLFEFEVIVIDDGSTDGTFDLGLEYSEKHPNFIFSKTSSSKRRNPGHARNIGYRKAKGEIVIAQSDEVIHSSEGVITALCTRVHEGFFIIANVFNYSVKEDKRLVEYTGPKVRRSLFFLGSLFRKDIYKIGGNDEEFVDPGYEDDFFGHCLIRGLGLKPLFPLDIIGLHQDHSRPEGLAREIIPSQILYQKKLRENKFVASGGSWKYE